MLQDGPHGMSYLSSSSLDSHKRPRESSVDSAAGDIALNDDQ